MDVIAEHHLVATYADSSVSPVVLRVGRPFAHPEGDHACAVQAEGLRIWKGPRDFPGIGTLHALILALRFLRSMVTIEMERGTIFRFDDDESPLTIDSLFPFRPTE